MKKIIYSILCICTVTLFTNCTDDDSHVFIADLSSETIAFQNSFASEYLLSKETKNNIADRLIWNATTLGVNNDYEVQSDIDSEFANPISIGTTNATNYAVLVGQLLDLASQLGLDDDPATTDSSGNPNNAGIVYFRVKSIIGNGGAGTQEIVSDIQSVNIKLLEKTVATTTCDPLWVVGDAIENVGWNFNLATVCDAGVQRVKASFKNGKFRFFQVDGDWNTGLNYQYYEDNGYTIDVNFESEGEGDFNFVFVGTTGIYEMVIDDNLKTIKLNPSGSLWAVGGATPGKWNFTGGETELVETSPDIWQATFALTNDIFRFFATRGEWDINNNYAHYADEGYAIDANFENDGSDDANFKFIGTPGTYTLTINAVDKTITLD
ncbi:SusE domain-containing protein [Mariniflexile soesokkakense]|uniref:SusE domain-containing protein n=1 Tax=Mariniflexile soesokkakense TaxID=1343160 RepID=A0ABV0ADI8_9FLAO